MDNEKLNILKLLIENKEANLSIRKISKIRSINYKSAYNALKQLESQGIVELKKLGNTVLCKFNMNFNELVYQVEYARRQDLIKDKSLQISYKRLAEIGFPFICLLFGSQAKKKAAKHSDFDLLIVTLNEERIRRVINTLALNIHTTYVTYEEFMRMSMSKEFSVVGEAIRDNIILIGIEEYYRLIKNAGQ